MSKLRAIIVLVLLVVFSAAVWFVMSERVDGARSDRAAAGDTASDAASALAADAGASAGEAGAERSALEGGELAPQAGRGAASPIVGRVVGPDGSPVSGARVTCAPPLLVGFGVVDADEGPDFGDVAGLRRRAAAIAADRAETTTDADGRFEVTPRGEESRLDLWVLARGYVVQGKPVTRPRDAARDVGAIELQRGAVVRGKVVDATSRPVAGATVRHTSNNSDVLGTFVLEGGDDVATLAIGMEVATTDTEGCFELQHVRAGDFALVVRHAQHPRLRVADLKVEVETELSDLLLQLGPPAAISGRVVDPPADVSSLCARALRRPVEGDGRRAPEPSRREAEVTCDVAADGTFTLAPLEGGVEYDVWLADRIRTWPGFALASQVVQVRAGATGVDLRYEAGVGVAFTVLDGRGGAPLEKLWVEATLRDKGRGYGWPPPVVRLVEYPQGRVVVGGLRPRPGQTLTLRVDGTGYSRFEREGIELPLTGSVDLGTVRLQPAPVVRVRVVDKNGEPVPGASARLAKKDGGVGNPFERFMASTQARGPRAARTDADGRCVLNADLDVESELTVRSNDFAPYRSEAFEVGAEGADRDVQLLLGGSVAVEAVDERGQPLAKATVAHKGPGADELPNDLETDPAGRVVFERLPPGEHGFRLRDGGEGPMIRFGNMSGSFGGGESKSATWESVEVVDEVRTSVRITKAPPAQLSGVVRENGVPLAHARVTFQRGAGDGGDLRFLFVGADGGKSAETDGEGRYTFEGLVAGEHRLRITHDDRAMSTTVPVTLAIGANVADVELDVTSVRGVVRTGDGKPVAGARVRVQAPGGGGGIQFGFVDVGGRAVGGGGGGKSVETDAEGAYLVRGVASGKPVVLEVRADDFVTARSAPFEVQSGATKSGVDMTLMPAGHIRVHATAGNGNGVLARAVEQGDQRRQAQAGFDKGEAMLKNLAPGRWSLTIHLGPEQVVSREVEVVAGRTTRVDV
ncbi:MAG: carboxypeptidase-like regulatory domain-containing protein [Planctomycetota bacterium]